MSAGAGGATATCEAYVYQEKRRWYWTCRGCGGAEGPFSRRMDADDSAYDHDDAARDSEICGESYDHDLPEPEYVDGVAVLVCRRCGAEIFEDEAEL